MAELIAMIGRRASLGLVIVTITLPCSSFAQVHRMADITKSDYESLDRDQTAVLLPLGVIEEHGPYLPMLTDIYWAEWIVDEVAESIVDIDGWSALIMPSLPIGVGAPEDFGPRDRSFGSIPLRPSTKRAVLMDLVTGLGDAGFRWIFVVDIHGPAINRRITDEASQYFEDIYGGKMVNLTGVAHPDPPAKEKPLSDGEREEDGLGVHAGLDETSRMKYLRPDLVRPEHTGAAPVTANSDGDFESIAMEDDWPGYFGSPRLARADIGEDLMNAQAENASDLALRIISGFDHSALGRFADTENAALKRLDIHISERSQRILKQQKDWMKKNGIQE